MKSRQLYIFIACVNFLAFPFCRQSTLASSAFSCKSGDFSRDSSECEEYLGRGNLDLFKKSINEESLHTDFLLHKIVDSSYFWENVHSKITRPSTSTENRIKALDIILKEYDREFLVEMANDRLFRNRNLFECLINEEPIWTEGTLSLFKNGLIDPSQYAKLLGKKRRWDASIDSSCLLFEVDFSFRGLANKAFFKIVPDWTSYLSLKNSQVKDKDSLILGIRSLVHYFFDVSDNSSKRKGFPFFWTRKYYHTLLENLLKAAERHTKNKNISTDMLIFMNELEGDLSFRRYKMIAAEESYKTCLKYLPCVEEQKYRRISKKLSNCYDRDNDTKNLSIVNDKIEQKIHVLN